MAGKKDNVVIAVVSDLTSAQAAELQKQIQVAKRKCAPQGRGTIATGTKNSVGGLLQAGIKRTGIASRG